MHFEAFPDIRAREGAISRSVRIGKPGLTQLVKRAIANHAELRKAAVQGSEAVVLGPFTLKPPSAIA